jgi:predicted TIM-barrel fold metal-dependent hydrolase
MTVTSPIALPESMRSLEGRILDCDTHEMTPAQEWVERFGPEVEEFANVFLNNAASDAEDKNHPNTPNYAGDVAAIGPDIVDVKGCRAPGAFDMRRRLDVMDAMGVSKQLMFPTSVGLWGAMVLSSLKYDPDLCREIGGDRPGKLKRWIQIYNEWMAEVNSVSDRIRPVPFLVGYDSVEELMANARALVEAGFRAVWLSAGALPGGRSPAHPDLDPFWSYMAESDCVITFHIGTEPKFWESQREWSRAPAFEGYKVFQEFRVDPWHFSMIHIPVQNYIGTLINGGVLERHPRLRFGVAEVAGYWVGPMLELLDMWYEKTSMFAPGNKLPTKPSTYFRNNFRVALFGFEDVSQYLSRYPDYGLEDIFCFSSDYPHVEGGHDAARNQYEGIKHLGPEVVEKFFVTNGQFLFPD